MAEIVRENGKVLIEGVPKIGWGIGKECTFVGALEAALSVTEHPYKYADLMGLSGLAFRVRWSCWNGEPGWCPSCAVGEFPDEIEAIEQTTGWQLRDEVHLGASNPRMGRFAPQIAASIDSGKPVLAYEPCLNMDVVYGYKDGGKTLFLRDYSADGSSLRLPASKLGAYLIFLEDHNGALPQSEALVKALSMGVKNWKCRRGPCDPDDSDDEGMYWYGDAALENWIDDIARYDRLSDIKRLSLFSVSIWNFCALRDARHAAVDFLHRSTAACTGDACESLARAAGFYEQEVELLDSAYEKHDAFPGQWSGDSIERWSDVVRKREREIFSECRKLEASAVAEMEKALSMMQ